MRNILGAVAVLAVLPGAAVAEEFEFAPRDTGVYARLSTGTTFLFLPEVNGFGGSIDDDPYNFIRAPDEAFSFKGVGFGGAVTLGLDLAELGLPVLGASRFEATLHGYSVRDRESRPINSGPYYYDVIAVDGSGSFTTYSDTVFQVKAEANEIAGDLMGYWDYPSEGGGGFSLGVGVTGGYSAVTYTASDIDPGDETVEKARTNFFGPQVAIDWSLPVAKRTTLILGAKVAGLWVDGDLDARQTNGGVDYHKVSDSENWLAAKGTLSAAMEFALWGPVSARVGAEGSYLTGAPQIVNPEAGPGDNVSAGGFRPAHLDHDSAWSGQAMLTISFALGGF